jgi:hypothetical protein
VLTLDANILIGTDFLSNTSAVIDVGGNTMKLGKHSGEIGVNCRHEDRKDTTDVRAIDAYMVLPGHVAQVPVTFGKKPLTDLAYFEPSPIHQEHLRVARSVHKTNNESQCVQVMNAGRTPLSLQKGQSLGTLQPLIGPSPIIQANVAQPASKALAEALALIDVNPDFSSDETLSGAGLSSWT